MLVHMCKIHIEYQRIYICMADINIKSIATIITTHIYYQLWRKLLIQHEIIYNLSQNGG